MGNKTFAIIKPDAVESGNIGNIFCRRAGTGARDRVGPEDGARGGGGGAMTGGPNTAPAE